MRLFKILILSFLLFNGAAYAESKGGGGTPGDRITEKLMGKSNDSAKEVIKSLYDRQVKYLQAQESQAENPDEVMQKQLSGTFMSVLFMMLPFLSLAGMVLFIWSIKVLLIDDPQRHGGPASATMSGGFKLIVSLILMASPKIAAMMKADNLDITKAEILSMLINIGIITSMIMGLIVTIIGVYNFTKRNHDREFPIIKSTAMVIGGLILINIKSIIYIFLGI